MFHFNFNT